MRRSATPLVYIVETPIMAEYCHEVLEHFCRGVEVRTFSDPKEAVDAFSSARVRPQVICTSIVSMQGLELAENVKEIDPSVRVLLMSGLGFEDIREKIDTARVSPDAVLPKPFAPEAFCTKVQALIE